MSLAAIHLVVEDGGQKRKFKVTPGRLSIGRGVHAQLKLTDESIAEEHAELEIGEQRGTLHLKTDAPARIRGKPLHGDVALESGVTVALGEAKLTLHYEQPAEPAVQRAPSRPGAARAAARRALEEHEETDEEREKRERREAKEKRARQTKWLIGGLIGIVALIGVIFAMLPKTEMSPEEKDARQHLADAQKLLKAQQWDRTEIELGYIKPEYAGLPEFSKVIDELKATLAVKRKDAVANAEARFANDWLKVKLKDFETNWLEGQPNVPAARLFLKRCAYFKSHWPTHPEIDWVTRNEERFKGVIDAGGKPSFADLEFEVKLLSYRVKVPNYGEIFAAIDAYRPLANSEEDKKLDAMVAEQKAARETWFKDTLDQARQDFETDRKALSMDALMNVVAYSADAQMAADAANRMQGFPDFELRMRQCKQDQPFTWTDLMKEPSLAAWAKAKGIR